MNGSCTCKGQLWRRQHMLGELYTLFLPCVLTFDPLAAVFSSTDQCRQAQDSGPCRTDMKVMWYFDYQDNTCKRFWYGCQGNSNRFKSEKECQTVCQRRAPGTMSRPCDLALVMWPCLQSCDHALIMWPKCCHVTCCFPHDYSPVFTFLYCFATFCFLQLFAFAIFLYLGGVFLCFYPAA